MAEETTAVEVGTHRKPAELADVFRTFKTDRDKEREGAWVEVPLNEGSLPVKIRPWMNTEHAAAYLAAMAPHQKEIDEETFSDEESDRIHAETMVGTVLMDWGLVHKGQPVPFKEEYAVALLFEVPRFREGVARAARRAVAFQDENLEAAAEKLGKAFGGGSSIRGASRTKRTKKG